MAAPAPASRPLVLVADGDDRLRALVRDAVGDAGHEVVEARTGEEAVLLFERHRPGLVVLDADLEGIDGAEACRQVRERNPGDLTPILVMTHSQDPDATARAFAAGASDFLTKPIDWAGFVHRIRFLVRATQRVGDLRRERISLVNAQRLARLGSFELDYATRTMRWSDQLCRILGFEPDTATHDPRQWWHAIHPVDRARVRQEAKEALEESGTYVIEHRVVTPDGRVRHVRQQAELLMGAHGNERWLVGTLQDVTEQKLASRQIWYLANFDTLTGLANRRHFHQHFDDALSRARRCGTHVGLLYLDLDGFKHVNDTLGHSAGDQLLCHVADLLRGGVRESDLVGRPEGEDAATAVSRLGGDEFTVLLTDMESPKDAGDVAERILTELPTPLVLEGQEVRVSGSIGISVFPGDGDDVDALMKCADAAMYHAKDKGRNGHAFFSSRMTEDSRRRLQIEKRLQVALAEGGLALHYQPKLHLSTRAPVGAEALLRWTDDELGVVSPKDVIPVAEEAGLIVELGRWVLEEGARQAAAWQRAGLPPIPLAVNVSPAQLARENAVEQVTHALLEVNLEPHLLEIEITETVLMQDDERVATQLRDLRAMGVRVALDDFGTGYSSLSYLTRFPLDVLKLDRCFTRDVDTDPGAEGVVRAVVGMAHSLGLRVVAEGIDTEDQAQMLRRLGCDEGQGFLFCGALEPDAFAAFVAKSAE